MPKMKATILCLLILLSLSGCSSVGPNIEPTAEQLARKQSSEQRLLAEDVPINQLLPVIADESSVRLRAESEVESRAMCLIVLGVKSEGISQKLVEKIIREYDLDDKFSPWEKEFVFSDAPAQRDKAIAKWRYESASVLLWSLGLVDSLARPDQFAEVPTMVRLINKMSTDEFHRTASLRPASEILDAADLTYRYHWAAHEALINRKKSPTGIVSGVIYERHYALNWLISYENQEWDDVTTDDTFDGSHDHEPLEDHDH